MQCPRCQQDNPSANSFCGGCGTLLQNLDRTPPKPSYADLQHSLTEALEQQSATAEILRVISSSPTDIQPVFDTVVRTAGVVCGAVDAVLWTIDAGELVVRAHHGPIPAALGARQPIHGSVAGYAVHEARVVHVEDLTEADDFPVGRDIARRLGWRTTLSAPLLREGIAIGAILIRRSEVRPFTDRQIALLQTFAGQAVIAIENVRLFTELEERNQALTEALEQQTATSEILKVISSSPTDVQPVFDAVAESARQLCNGEYCVVESFDGERLHFGASDGLSPEGLAAFRQALPRPVSEDNAAGRAVLRRMVAQIPDVLEDPTHGVRSVALAANYRSAVAVPMLRHGQPIGAIVVARSAVGSFPERQIELLKTFADQAVIAIENVRLFKELESRNRDLTTALDRQTATADVLRIIAQSPTELQPVLDAIATSAMRLCKASDAVIERLEGDRFYNAAHAGTQMKGLVGLPLPLTRRFPGGRAVLDRQRVIIDDIHLVAEQEYPDTLELLKLNAIHSVAEIPLLSEGKPLGTIAVLRAEVRPFTDAEVTLLETFADQAVIAIENVRLFTELQEKNRALTQAHGQVTEALEQQTATSEILQVISSSPTDVQPTFAAIAASARRLCEAAHGMVFRFDGELINLAAHDNLDQERLDAIRSVFPIPPGQGSVTARAILTRAVVHVRDRREDPDLEYSVLNANFPNTLSVPLLRDGVPLGAITVTRAEIGLFSNRQIALLRTFADQAVIAIENVRLFTELQARNRELTTALDTQTATSDILRAISRSQTDVQPVFDAIVESAVRLLRGFVAAISRLAGDQLELAAFTSTDPAGDAAVRSTFPQSLESDGPHSRVVREGTLLNVTDARSDPQLPEAIRNVAVVRGYQSLVVLPMLRYDEAIGAISLTRRERGGFTDDEISLLQTFADQAVIAIENARLLNELQDKNESLTQAHAQVTEALEQQTATAEILRVISSSPTDVQPVFDAIVASATRLCEADLSGLYQFDGALIHFAAQYGRTPEEIEAARQAFPQPLGRASVSSRAILGATVVQVPDVREDPEMAGALRALFRTVMAVPMLRDGRPIGTITVARRVVRPFSEVQIALLQAFADQAVIAIENVRLFTELQQRTRELTRSVEKLTALGEVSQAVSSTLDLEMVLDTITERARQLAGADGGVIYEYDEVSQQFFLRATRNVDATLIQTLRVTPLRKGEGVMGRATETREPIQIADIAAPGVYESHLRDVLIGAGYRALLSVPIVREGQTIGSLSLNRKAPGEFPPEVIDVLKTFATQSALAIQNARLFREIADKSRQLEVASQHKSEFLANMSHELRTPLNAIIGFSEVLTERMFGELNEKQEEYLKDIYASGTHLLSLINDILDLSKIEAGRMELELTHFDLPTALDNALMLVRERAQRRSLTLQKDVDAGVGQIRADERKIRQVVLNLLSNAIKFTPEGGRIDLAAVPKDGFVEVSVSDTGIGIAPEDQEKVFEEFRQVGTADKKAEGTGLGLTLCRKFIELHGGRIWVESQLGAGSTFTFTLPVRRGE